MNELNTLPIENSNTTFTFLNNPEQKNTNLKLENADLTQEERQNIFSVSLIEFVGRILIEKMFFHNLHIPQELLLSIANSLIQTLTPDRKTRVNVNLYQEGVILYKQLTGKILTTEEALYDKAVKNIDVPGEILNGIKYSALALMGSNLYTSVTSVINQGLWNHVPGVVGYASATVLGPKIIQAAVEKILAYSGLTQEQKKELAPWLNMIGRLALGFIPKVRANEQGVHYHYPSIAGYTKTVTSQESITLAGNHVTLERQGNLHTTEGDIEANVEVQFKLHSIHQITEERIKLQVINQEGKKIPVEFYITQSALGREITIKSTDKKLEAQWEEYFQPKSEQPALSPNIAEINTSQITQVQINPPSSLSKSTDLTCESTLLLSAVTSAVGQNILPVMLGALSCLPKASAAGEPSTIIQSETPKRSLEQASTFSLNVVNLPLDNQVKDIVIESGYAYTVNGQAGLKIMDIRDTNNATLISQYDTPGDAQRIVLDKGYAYIADGSGGMQIVNVKNVTNPIWTGMWMTENSVSDVAVVNGKAYIANGTKTVSEINISVPEAVYHAIVPGMSSTLNVAVSGNFAYVADYYGKGLCIIDMGNSANPRLAGNISVSTTRAYGVAISGNFAYVVDGISSLYVIDVSNATNPRLVGNVSTTYAVDVAVSGNFAYVAGNSFLHIIDVSNATNPILVGNVSTTYAMDVAVSGNFTYVVGAYSAFSALQVFDVSNAMNPKLVGSINTTYALDVDVVGNFAYVADGNSGLRVIDVSNAINPQLVGSINTTYAQGIAISRNFAYVADYNSGLRVIDVSNATNPQLVGSINMTYAKNVAVSGIFVYVADMSSSLKIIGTNLSISPQTYSFSEPITQVVIESPYAFMVTNNTLNIWNIADPAQKQYIGGWNNSFTINHAEVIGNQLLLGHSVGIAVLDISNITIPTLVTSYNCTMPVQIFTVNNGTLYLPASYQCQFQTAPNPAAAPAPQSTNSLTPCPIDQSLILRNNDIQINKGQNLRLSPNDLSASCGNDTVPNLDTAFNITGINHAQFKTRNSSGFWSNATRFFGGDLARGNIVLVHDNSTNTPEINFTITDGKTNIPETVAKIRGNITDNSISKINAINLEIQFNGTTILTTQQFQISDSDNKLDNLVISIDAINNGYFETIDNPTVPLKDFTYYQLASGKIQFVHNGTTLPSVTLGIEDGSGKKVPFRPFISFFGNNQSSSKPVPVGIIAGATAGVVASAAVAGLLFYKIKYRPLQENRIAKYNAQAEREKKHKMEKLNYIPKNSM